MILRIVDFFLKGEHARDVGFVGPAWDCLDDYRHGDIVLPQGCVHDVWQLWNEWQDQHGHGHGHGHGNENNTRLPKNYVEVYAASSGRRNGERDSVMRWLGAVARRIG